MEKRRNKITYAKSGKGNITTRISIPASWLEKAGIENEATLTLLNNKIIMSKGDLKMTLEQVKIEIKIEIDEEMKRVGFICDSDDQDRFIDEMVDKYINLLDIKYTADDVECSREDADTAIFEGEEYKCWQGVIDPFQYDLIEEMRQYCNFKYNSIGENDNGNLTLFYTIKKYNTLKEFAEENGIVGICGVE